MRRLKILFILLLALSLSGCIEKYTFTEDKSDAIAEGMAGLILKYDPNYKEGLISELELQELSDKTAETDGNTTETASDPGTTAENVNVTGSGSESSEEYTLSQVIGQKGCDIRYTGYKLVESYPEDATNTGFLLTPSSSGDQLLIVGFEVNNNSNNDMKLNLIDSDILYQLEVDGSMKYKPLLTLLENDLQYIDIAIKGGESGDVMLIFEITKDVDMSNVSLIVSNDDKSNTIKLK